MESASVSQVFELLKNEQVSQEVVLPTEVVHFCEEEAIHLPGAIKSHGVLIALEEPQLRIVQISKNSNELLGIPPEELLNKELKYLLGSKQVNAIKTCLLKDFSSVNPLKISLKQKEKTKFFDGIIHRHDEVVILEMEPTSSKNPVDFLNFHRLVKATIDKIQKASTTLEMCHMIVEEISQLTGFDRVFVYQFDEDGAGCVIAEKTKEGLTPYLGLHYPSTDIPKQAKRLFHLNKVRTIPDVSYQPQEIVPCNNPITGRPLDLSWSVLRSASIGHIEYLKNMGVGSTMTISLSKNKQLWGMISCHHMSANYVNYEIRTVCELLGEVISLKLSAQEDNDDLDYKIKLNTIQSNLIHSVSQANNLVRGLLNNAEELKKLVDASGAAICFKDEIDLIGNTPAKSEIQALVNWLAQNVEDNIFSTNSLPKIYPQAEQFKEVACGLLVLTLSKVQGYYLIWFRPEVLQTVCWAGNPMDSYRTNQEGVIFLCPRKSFELWKESVKGRSLPWKKLEIEAVQKFRSTLVGIFMRQAEELASLNFELQRRNEELDSFAYIASHDLKEPLRGIHNYANFLMEDYAIELSADGVNKLETLVRLTQRMETLINSLLLFSRLGRAEIVRQSVNLDELVQQVIGTLSIARPQTEIEFRIPRPLPYFECDRTQITELFTNLISNAIKYNDKPQKWVEIGYLDSNENGKIDLPSSCLIFYVRDNGIGIPAEHLEKIFQIFRRLHGRDDFGGGTGAGLTIARKIVERHGGRIYVESKPGFGSTFYFTLMAEVSS